MTEERYGWAQHRTPRTRYAHQVATGQATCTEPICIKRSRWINPLEPWDLAHDRTTGEHRGPAHRACNRAEGARYGNHLRGQRQAAQPARRWTSRRWQ